MKHKGSGKSKASKPRVFTEEFKAKAVERIAAGEPIRSVSRDLKVRRSVLYRWRDAYREKGRVGLRPPGRPARTPAAQQTHQTEAEICALQRTAELERLVGRLTLDLDFLRRAFKRAVESKRRSTGAGDSPSTERSGQ